MKYTTAKEFMQAIPNSMYVDLDNIERPHIYNYSIDRTLAIRDSALSAKVVNQLVTHNVGRMSSLWSRNPSDIEHHAENILREYMAANCDILILHETVDGYDWGADDHHLYKDMNIAHIAKLINDRLNTFMRVSCNRIIMHTADNIGNSVFYVITTSAEAVIRINEMAGAEFLTATGQLLCFYNRILAADWFLYDLEEIDDSYELNDNKWIRLIDNADDYWDREALHLDEVVQTFCKYIALDAYYDITIGRFKHFNTAAYNASYIKNVMLLPINNPINKDDPNAKNIQRDFKWVCKEIRKLIPLDGTGIQISSYLLLIARAVASVEITTNIKINTADEFGKQFAEEIADTKPVLIPDALSDYHDSILDSVDGKYKSPADDDQEDQFDDDDDD